MSITKPVVAFLSGLGFVVFGLVAVPMTVAALGQPLTITCTGAFVDYDPGYGIGQLAASPSCTVTILSTGRVPS